MSVDLSQKITIRHTQRDAFLYVRQSSVRQVFENTESTKRQYALRDLILQPFNGQSEAVFFSHHKTHFQIV